MWAIPLLQAERESEAQTGAAARAAAAAAELESAAAGHRTEAHQLRAAIEAADQVQSGGSVPMRYTCVYEMQTHMRPLVPHGGMTESLQKSP